MGDMLDNSTKTISSIIVAVVLICSALIPIAVTQMNGIMSNSSLQTAFSNLGIDSTMYISLISVVIIICIVGLVIGVVKTYSGGRERD